MGSATAATPKRRRREPRALAAATLLTALFAGSALACGYENPQSVALGVMNWVYPKSLYVRTAVWQAEDAGVLPPRETKPEKDLFSLGFRRAVDSLNGLGARVENAGGNDFHFSVVLIPQVM
ncbi:hypothetical protein [Ensifer sp. MJa1]|uniref:hypothetical protein n=1 Tax=Ensifer sp. MJa1 TaxID=2919888 RepID=UPI003009DC50